MGNVNDAKIASISEEFARKHENSVNLVEFLDGKLETSLGQLLAWPLEEVKGVYDKYKRLCHFPMIDRISFCKLLPFSRRNATYIFADLVRTKKPVLFSLFDLSGKQNLVYNQWAIMAQSFVHAVARMYKKSFIPIEQLQRISKIIFIKADIAPYDNTLEYSELKDWVETCAELVSLFQKYEPPFPIKEKVTVFYSFKPYTDQQVEELVKWITRYAKPENIDVEEIKELIEKTARSKNTSPKLFEEIKPVLSRKTSLIIKTINEPLIMNNKSQISNKKPVFLIPLSPNAEMNPPQKNSFLSARNTSLPKLKTSIDFNPIQAEKVKIQELLERKKNYGKKIESVQKNKGKTITKHDVIKLKSYFDSMADGEGKLPQKNFVEHFSKLSNLQKVSASLFSFLDGEAHGYITFSELVKKLYPNLSKEEFDQVLKWSKEEELFVFKKTHKRYIEEKGTGNGSGINLQKMRPMYEVPKEALKKMKSIFELFDEEKKGYVSRENFAKKFSSMYPPKEIDRKFEQFDKDKDGMLSLKEFIEVILPPDFYIDPSILSGS